MQKVKRFKEVPLLNPTYEDIYYASYEARYPRCLGHKIFVPKENNTVSINHTFNSAYKFGTTHVEMGKWMAFELLIEHGEAAGAEFNWPHIHLLPVLDKKEENEGE